MGSVDVRTKWSDSSCNARDGSNLVVETWRSLSDDATDVGPVYTRSLDGAGRVLPIRLEPTKTHWPSPGPSETPSDAVVDGEWCPGVFGVGGTRLCCCARVGPIRRQHRRVGGHNGPGRHRVLS